MLELHHSAHAHVKQPSFVRAVGGIGMEQVAPAPMLHSEDALDPTWAVLIHNDDVTPYEYVLHILEDIFTISDEQAEHIAWTAHTEGQAIVVVRRHDEARRLVTLAHSHARADGYPLTFSVELQPQ